MTTKKTSATAQKLANSVRQAKTTQTDEEVKATAATAPKATPAKTKATAAKAPTKKAPAAKKPSTKTTAQTTSAEKSESATPVFSRRVWPD